MTPATQRVLLVLAAVLLAAAFWAGLGGELGAVVEWVDWMRDGGPAGLMVFAAAYAVGTWLMLPASWLQGTAGFVFGPVGGLVVASVMSTSSGTVSFLLAKTVLRQPLLRRFTGPRLRAIDMAVGEGGVGLVALLRLSPISPYNVVNYLLGLTGVRTRDYVVGTWMGSLVPVALYAYVGSSVSDLSALFAGEAESPSWVQWVGLALTVVVTLGVTRFAKTTLNRTLARAQGSESAQAPSASPPTGPAG